jgi:MFS family permease
VFVAATGCKLTGVTTMAQTALFVGEPMATTSSTTLNAYAQGAVRLGPAGTAALACSYVLIFIAIFSLAPALPAIRAHFALTADVDLLTRLVGATAGFSFALGSLAAGRLITRFGYRTVYLSSLIAFAMAGAGGGALNNLYAINASRVIVGLAAAGIINASLVAIGVLVPASSQPRLLGMQTVIGSISAVVLYPVIGQLAGIDWRLAFAVQLLALLMVPLVLALPVINRVADSGEVRTPARNVGLMTILTVSFGGMVVFIASVFAPLYLAQLGVTQASLLSIPPTASAIGSVGGSLAYGFLYSRLGLWRLFAFSLGAMAVGLFTMGISGAVWGVAIGSLVTTFGTGAFSPNLNAAAIAASPDNPGRALGTVNAAMYGAMILFPLIATPLAVHLGGLGGVLLGYAALASLLMVFYIVKPAPSSRSREQRTADGGGK